MSFILCLILPLCLLFHCIFLSGCDMVYRHLDEDGAEEKDLIGVNTIYEENPTVKEIQQLLKVYGFDPGADDGVLGPRTRETLSRFQKETGLEITKKVDAETWQKLKIHKDTGLIRGGTLNIALLQEYLMKAGYDPGKPDGEMGPKTLNAVREFQKDNGLSVDGKPGFWTMTKLCELTGKLGTRPNYQN